MKPNFKFRERSIGEVDEWNARLKLAFDAEGNQIRDYSEEEAEYILSELNLSKWDFLYWANRYCIISAAETSLVRLNLVPSQQKMLNRMGELEEATYPQAMGKFALIVAKARRVGATVLAQAAVAHNVMLRSQAKGLVASNEPSNSLELFKILSRIHQNLPPWMRPKMTGRVKGEHFYFEPPLDSDITIGHGAQKTPMGQGVRLDAIHLSEMSTWMGVGTEQVDADMLPAFNSSRAPSTFVIIESTGESAMDTDGKYFRVQYEMAKQNKGDFRHLFLSWYDRPDLHTRNAQGITFSDLTLAAATRIQRDTGFELSREQMAFYQVTREQYEEKGKLTTFLREFPSSDDECFLYAETCAWSAEVLDRVRNDLPEIRHIYDVDAQRRKLVGEQDPKNWDNDPNNRIFIFEPPRFGFTYSVGVDASHGEEGHDYAAIQVVRVGSKFAKDMQVAEFCGYCSPDDLAGVAWILGHYYFDKENGLPALMAVEKDGPGLVTLTELMKMGYTNLYKERYEDKVGFGQKDKYGWKTTGITRPLITKKIVDSIRKDEIMISSAFFLEEMKHFINHGFKVRGGGVDGHVYYAHAQGEHDDKILALSIAFHVAHQYDQLLAADERRKLVEEKVTALLPSSSRSYQQSSDWSWEDAIEDFESRLNF